jgi:hypothetical protein
MLGWFAPEVDDDPDFPWLKVSVVTISIALVLFGAGYMLKGGADFVDSVTDDSDDE